MKTTLSFIVILMLSMQTSLFAQGYQQETANAPITSEDGVGFKGYRPQLKKIGKSGKMLSLADNGESAFQIVLPDHFDNDGIRDEVSAGAKILQKAFLESAGAEIAIVKEEDMDESKPSIFNGNTRQTQANGILCKNFYGYDCVIACDGRNLYLAGNDRHTAGRKEATKHKEYFYIAGSLRAMIIFMDQYMETRFLLPGEIGIEFAELDTIAVKADLHEFRPQPLEYATGSMIDFLFDVASNNYGHCTFLMQGGHSYYSAVRGNQYGKTNPEYFALRNGKREPALNHLCISNPDVQRLNFEFSRDILLNIKDRRNGTEIGQTDGFLPCECENCAKYGNTRDWGEKLWLFHKDLAEQLNIACPGKEVVIISYGPTANPPKTFNTFPENVIIELCNYRPEDFEQWKSITVPGGISIFTYWGPFFQPGLTPSKSPRSLWKDYKLFQSSGKFRGVTRCGHARSFGLEGASYYVFAKLLDYPEADYNALAEEYYSAAFSDCAREMREFFTLLYQRVDAFRTLDSERELPDNPRPYLVYAYSPDLLAKLEHLLSNAEKTAYSDKVKKRLFLVRKEFDYVKHTATVLHFYHAYLLKTNEQTFELLASAIEERNTYIDSLFDSNGQKKPIHGWLEVEILRLSDRRQIQLNGMYAAQLETPLGWNVDFLRKSKMRPADNSVRQAIAAVPVGKIDKEDFTAAAWQNASWQQLAGYQGSVVSKQTRFKVLYDEKAVYFAIESELEAEKTFVVAERDGSQVYAQDCIELMIDPEGNRKMHYHLIYNPVENSKFDRAFGLIQDTLDPRYGQPDPSWNGEWSYSTVRKAGKWLSVVTIPYTTLKVSKPTFTSLWTINVGRTIRTAGQDAEYSLWSPQMGKFDFSDRDSFGELKFASP